MSTLIRALLFIGGALTLIAYSTRINNNNLWKIHGQFMAIRVKEKTRIFTN